MGIHGIENLTGLDPREELDPDDVDNEEMAGPDVSEDQDPVPDDLPEAPEGGFYGEDDVA